MRFLVFGVSGMLGRTIAAYLEWRGFGVERVSRKDYDAESLDYLGLSSLLKTKTSKGDWVINCIGAIPQRYSQADQPHTFVKVNAVFPHLLAAICHEQGLVCFHPTTDCVYNGSKGSSYTPDDKHDETAIYGVSKSCGEPPGAMVLRTSIIGEEDGTAVSLLEWVRSCHANGEEIQGFVNHFWNGLTCLQVAKLVEACVLKGICWTGVHVVGSERLSKFDLIVKIARAYGLEGLLIAPTTTPVVDKSLTPTSPPLFDLPPMDSMLEEQAAFWSSL